MKTMPGEFIYDCLYELPALMDSMKAEGPKHIYIFKEDHKYRLK